LLPLLGGFGGTSLIVASSLGGLVMSVAAALFFLVRAGLRPWPRVHRAIAGEALSFGLKSHVGRVAAVLNWRLDVMILAAFASVEVVGCYAVASKTAELFRPLGASLTYVLRPLIAGLDAAQARKKGVALYRWVFAINLTTVVIMALVGGPLILLLFGEEFAPAVPAFQILLIGLAAHGADPVLNGYYIGIGRPEVTTYASLAGLAVTVIGDLTLIPAYSLIGAAIASSAAYSVHAVALTAVFLLTSRVSLRELLGIEELSPGPA
jgi:O-antigen/teichoic acid export membrane protein